MFLFRFCVFKGESIEVGYKILTKWTSRRQSANF